MLRLPPYAYHRPRSIAEAVDLMGRHPGDAMYISGGTDLVPNMKHRLFEPGHLVALRGLAELRGIEKVGAANAEGTDADSPSVEGSPSLEGSAGVDGSASVDGPADLPGYLRIGAAETLTSLSVHPRVRALFPALAEAAGHVAGPQLRNAGTLGGNVCLETRCTYYNQTEFWRAALGYCLKKDGDVCHVTRVGKKCVAAHSADTPPVLITLDASLELVGPEGSRVVPVRDFFVADGIANTVRSPAEVVTEIRIPLSSARRRQGYAKLRQRKSIDFPLLTVAVAAQVTEGVVRSIAGVVTGLGSRPRVLSGWSDLACGRTLDDGLVEELAARAHQQCHPLENITVDPDWRRAMVPTYVRRALRSMRAA